MITSSVLHVRACFHWWIADQAQFQKMFWLHFFVVGSIFLFVNPLERNVGGPPSEATQLAGGTPATALWIGGS